MGRGPSILVTGRLREERGSITATLVQAGFAVLQTAPAAALAALRRERFAAAILACAANDTTALLSAARRIDPALPILLLLDPSATPLDDVDDIVVVKTPLNLRQMLGCVFELVLRDADAAGDTRHSGAAEMGIAAAQLACLYNRRTVAAAAGATGLANDLTHQIGHMQNAYRGLAATLGAD